MDFLQDFTQKAINFFRIGAITGFLAATTLIINLHNTKFHLIFKDRAKRFWWLFLLTALIIFFVILYLFTVIFQKLGISEHAKSVFDFISKKLQNY